MEPPEEKTKFLVVGLMVTPEYQKCAYIVKHLHKTYPDNYEPPELKPMLNVAFEEYIHKEKVLKGGLIWGLEKPVAVFMNGEFMGDDEKLIAFFSKRYRLNMTQNFHTLGETELINYFQKILDDGRKFVFLLMNINNLAVGSMLFMLYNDIVPDTCNLFIKRCKASGNNGYAGKPVHRIVKNGWIQIGGYNMKPVRIQCENFGVSHNKRGIISMCNTTRHKNNSCQFLITLDTAPWMDTQYVAFGELIHGEDVLRKIEEIPTYYENPDRKVTIHSCDEFSLCPHLDASHSKMTKQAILDQYIDRRTILKRYNTDKYKYTEKFKGSGDDHDFTQITTNKMFLQSDLRSHKPFEHLYDKEKMIHTLSPSEERLSVYDFDF